MQNSLNGVVLQVTTENANVNAATMQVLQRMTIVAVDQPAAAQNSQNNNPTTIHNTLYNYNMVEVK